MHGYTKMEKPRKTAETAENSPRPQILLCDIKIADCQQIYVYRTDLLPLKI